MWGYRELHVSCKLEYGPRYYTQYLNTSFTSYHELIVKDLADMLRVEKDQYQDQASVLINT